jgi:transcriptional regulator with GAF, ATPase, and Fis domain
MEMKTLREREKEHLQKVLELTHWDLEKASRLLEVPLKQVKRKIREHDIVKEKPGIDK